MIFKLWSLSLLVASALGLPHQQTVLDSALQAGEALLSEHQDPSHLSRWCNQSKSEFLHALHNGGADQWTIVMGTEASDTDTMVSSLAFAHHLYHRKKNPEKAIALLQIDRSVLRLRKENELVLRQSRMGSVHRDLLTLDQLPFTREKLSQMVKGIYLVDQNLPLSVWRNAPVLGIVDHHMDRNVNSTAAPRLIKEVGSASSLVGKLILEEASDEEPTTSLADLILSAIAIDTKGLKKKKATKIDRKTAKGMYKYSSFKEKGEKLKKSMKKLAKDIATSRDDVKGLNVTDLLVRDFKGDMVYNSTLPVMVGYANVPISFKEMVGLAQDGSIEKLFEEVRTWEYERGINVLVVMTKFKDENGDKQREVMLAVRQEKLSEDEAERLYHSVRHALETDKQLDLQVWKDENDWGHRRYAWKQRGNGEGRKTIRPIIERGLQEW